MGRELELFPILLLGSECASPQELTMTDLTCFDCESDYDDYIICIPDSALACLHSTENTPLNTSGHQPKCHRKWKWIYIMKISVGESDSRSRILSLNI